MLFGTSVTHFSNSYCTPWFDLFEAIVDKMLSAPNDIRESHSHKRTAVSSPGAAENPRKSLARLSKGFRGFWKTEILDHPFADGVRSSYSTKTNKYWVLLNPQIWASNANWKWVKKNIKISSLAKLLSRLPDCLPRGKGGPQGFVWF